MRLFQILNQTMLDGEKRDAYAVREPRVWPSEASAVSGDQRVSKIVGKCHRQANFRMIGMPVTNPVDIKGAWKFELGRACERHVISLAKSAGIHAASGVKCFVKELCLPFEVDLCVVDPASSQGVITENKSYSGYYKSSQLRKGKPSPDNLMQTLIYLNEIKTGARFKEIVKTELDKKFLDDVLGKSSRNRIEATLENLDRMDDGPLAAKLAYEDRAVDNEPCEFDIGIFRHAGSGLQYPLVDGAPFTLFSVESIYERYRLLQSYWFRQRDEAARRLAERDVNPPAEGADESALDAWDHAVADEVRRLGPDWWPPAEYEWKYSDQKIEKLGEEGLIGKTIFKEWQMVKSGRNRKPRSVPRIGDWQCAFCSFAKTCIPVEYPETRGMIDDLLAAETPQGEGEVAA